MIGHQNVIYSCSDQGDEKKIFMDDNTAMCLLRYKEYQKTVNQRQTKTAPPTRKNRHPKAYKRKLSQYDK